MSFVGLYTGLTGVRAGQTGIDVAANNIANANTPGYTRQRVDLAARPSYTSLAGQIGTGVDVASISRLRDAFLDGRARSASADAADKGVRADLLGRLEDLTGEPETGIATRLGALWASAETWANDPADTASRRQVLTELSAVTETFRSVATQWDTLERDVLDQRDVKLTELNDALAQLTALDDRVANADPSRVGNEVFDQRDRLLDDVARLSGATARIGADGRSEVTLGGLALTSVDGPSTLSMVGGQLTATAPGGATTAVPQDVGGELGGLTQFLQHDLTELRAGLDQLAGSFLSAINGVNQGGVLANGDAGPPLVGYSAPPAAPGAASLQVLTGDPAHLAAARTGAPPAPHDNTNARTFADLRTTAVPDGAGGTRTLDGQLAEVVTDLAGRVRSARAAGDASRSISSQARTARGAEHGVSIDEEMVALVQHQRALEAASRVMTTIDEALEVLVNRTGIVGR